MAQLGNTVITGALRVVGDEMLSGRLTTTKAINDIIEGTGTTAQDKGSGVSPRYFPAKWTFNTGQTVTNGDIIVIKIPCAGHDFGVFISIDNGTTYKPAGVGMTGTGRLTTHFGSGGYVAFIYDSSGQINSVYPAAGGDAKVNVSGGCWRVVNYYDSGNTYDRNRYNCAILAWGTKILNANIIVAANDGKYHHLKEGTAFDIRWPILYLGADCNANATTSNTYDVIHFTVTTTQSISLTAYKPVYIKGTLSGTTFTPVSTTPLTQTVPTAWDDYAYILLGMATGTTTVYLQERHPIYKFYSGAFREWNDFEGLNIKASGNYSHAEGWGTSASGIESHAEGYYTNASEYDAHAEGSNTVASGGVSHAEGCDTVASGEGSHAEGERTLASEKGSHAEGWGTSASGTYSHAEGYFTNASEYDAHAEGSNTVASGGASHAEGAETVASGANSHAEGWYTTASGEGSHAEGCQTSASGTYSHAEGERTTASGESSHSEGYKSKAINSYSHAEGQNTTASKTAAHAEGYSTSAGGSHSHAEGQFTTATGSDSHAEGQRTVSSGSNSHVEGNYTTASNTNSHSSGHYNAAMTTGGSATNTTGTAFVIGNGTGSSALKNAFSVQFDGTVKAASTITASTTADYAEYFEWYDHNPNNEDRVGYFVTFLNNNKIIIAEPESDYILGVTSGEPFVLGNGDCDVWNGMVLRDEFRRVIYEPAPLIDTETGEQVIDEQGNPVYQGTRPKYNPDYDPTIPYINRADRPEWTPVGMLGVLAVRDDGTCEVNHYATIGEGGIATKAIGNNQNRYRVIHRNSPNVVEIVFR